MIFEVEKKAENFKFHERLIDGPLGNGDYPGLKREFLTPRFNTVMSDKEAFSD
jgi:hypothetical protein